jgi:single-stranded DNA-binding protein
MQMLGSAGRGGPSGGPSGGMSGGGESRGGARGGARSDDDGYSEPVRSSTEKDDFDDDIPF